MNILEVEGLRKTYPAFRLRDVSFAVRPGTIHALCGENGAGKSALTKILAGIYPPDSGEILLRGARIFFSSPAAAVRAGVAMVHQESDLAPDLTVAENIFLGREPRRFGLLDYAGMCAESRRQLERLGVSLDPRRMIDTLSVAEKQMVEIAKALSVKCRLLIMDEPTTVLNQNETAVLFRIMRELRAAGTSIIFISHRLEEIRTVCDRVAVLRDGVLVSCDPAPSLSAMEIARRMVGREVSQMFPPKRFPDTEHAVLSVEHLSSGREVRDVSFSLGRGITGFAGLAGAGRTELAEATELRFLSGGNQQKVALAKCLDIHPEVFIFDEPTRGVDIGARSDIYTFISELAQSGVACLLISSDLEEIIGMCDRVLVMRSGELAGCVERERVTEEEIMYLATGVQ